MAEAIQNSIGAPLTVMLIAMIPIFEARGAILVGMTIGLTPGEAFGYAFLGSSLMAPILLLVLIPIIKALSKTKFFSKIGKFLYDKFEKKSRSLGITADEGKPSGEKRKFKITKSDMKKIGGTAGFVAIPIPLTGVWTGSAVASILDIGFVKGLIGVIVGNAVACGIITLIGVLFKNYLIWITIGFAAIALIIVIVLIIKLIVYKPKTDDDRPVAAEKTENLNHSETAVPSSEYNITNEKNRNRDGDSAKEK